MVTMSVSLPDPLKEWGEAQIESGKYSNASDWVRDRIGCDQDCRDKREILVKALIEREKSGVSNRELNGIWASVKERHGADVRTRRGRRC